jgi:hypothetical protein
MRTGKKAPKMSASWNAFPTVSDNARPLKPFASSEAPLHGRAMRDDEAVAVELGQPVEHDPGATSGQRGAPDHRPGRHSSGT